MGEVVKLTGSESAILAFLAQNGRAYEQVSHRLGPEALKIAKYLVGIDNDPTDAVRGTGDAIMAWVHARRAREAQLRTREIVTDTDLAEAQAKLLKTIRAWMIDHACECPDCGFYEIRESIDAFVGKDSE